MAPHLTVWSGTSTHGSPAQVQNPQVGVGTVEMEDLSGQKVVPIWRLEGRSGAKGRLRAVDSTDRAVSQAILEAEGAGAVIEGQKCREEECRGGGGGGDVKQFLMSCIFSSFFLCILSSHLDHRLLGVTRSFEHCLSALDQVEA